MVDIMDLRSMRLFSGRAIIRFFRIDFLDPPTRTGMFNVWGIPGTHGFFEEFDIYLE
ncbi:hypothetical protein U1Q18_025609 [Sarracenia purpurea var. burkii]